jgi:hypothetical protein
VSSGQVTIDIVITALASVTGAAQAPINGRATTRAAAHIASFHVKPCGTRTC